MIALLVATGSHFVGKIVPGLPGGLPLLHCPTLSHDLYERLPLFIALLSLASCAEDYPSLLPYPVLRPVRKTPLFFYSVLRPIRKTTILYQHINFSSCS